MNDVIQDKACDLEEISSPCESAIDFLDRCDYEELQALCTTAGMWEPGFGKIFSALQIIPGELWMCFSDNEDSQREMHAGIVALLDRAYPSWKETEIYCDDEEDPPAYVLTWLQLRNELESLKNMHYKTLQKLCYSGGEPSHILMHMSAVLHINSKDWSAQFVAGCDGRERMISNIKLMFDKKMRYVTWEVFIDPNPTQIVPTVLKTPHLTKRAKSSEYTDKSSEANTPAKDRLYPPTESSP